MATKKGEALAREQAEEVEAGKAAVQAAAHEMVEVAKDEIRAEFSLDNVKRPPFSSPAGAGVPKIANRQTASWGGAPGAAADGMFDSFADFARRVSPQGLRTMALRNDYSSIDPSSGGFLVPEEFRSDLLSVSLDEAIVRPRATVMPMSSSSLLVPALDDTTHASDVFGGVTGNWTEEGGELAESEAKFARIRLQVAKLAIRSDVPNELLQDSFPAFDVVLGNLFSQAIVWFEDKAFLTGSGVGEPLGVTNSPALIVQSKEGGQEADTIVFENLAEMYSRLFSRSRRRAVWVCFDSCIPELLTLSIAVGTGGSAVSVMNERDGQFTMLGLPVFFSEHMPTLGDQSDILLADFSYYLIGDRAEMRLESSSHAQFTSDTTVFRAIERVDGRSWLTSAITPANSSSTRSAFVALEARA